MPSFLKQYSISYVHTINIPHTIYIVLSSVGNLEMIWNMHISTKNRHGLYAGKLLYIRNVTIPRRFQKKFSWITKVQLYFLKEELLSQAMVAHL